MRARGGLRAWWRDIQAFDSERLDAAIREFTVELRCRTQAHPACADAAEEHLQNASTHRDAGEIDGAWTLLKAAQREVVATLDATELRLEADRIRHEAAAKLTGWRAKAVEDALGDSCDVKGATTAGGERDRSVEELRTRVKEARRIVDAHSDNVYRRLHLLRGHLQRAWIMLAVMLVLTWVVIALASRWWGWSPTNDVLQDGISLLVVMLLGALGASLSGVLTLLARDRDQRIPDVRAQRLLVWLRPFVGAAAAVVAVSVLLSGLTGVRVAPEATAAVAFVAGFSERLVSRAVAAASAAIVN